MTRSNEDIIEELRKLPLEEYKALIKTIWPNNILADDFQSDRQLEHIAESMHFFVGHPNYRKHRLMICNFLDEYQRKTTVRPSTLSRLFPSKAKAAVAAFAATMISGIALLVCEYGYFIPHYSPSTPIIDNPHPSTQAVIPPSSTRPETTTKPHVTTPDYVEGDGDIPDFSSVIVPSISTQTAADFEKSIEEFNKAMDKTNKAMDDVHVKKRHK